VAGAGSDVIGADRIRVAGGVPLPGGPGDSVWNKSLIGENMNWDQIEGKWKQFTGSARERWGKLTDSDWGVIAGKKDQLVGRIQERYGVAKEEAEKQVDDWSRTHTATDCQCGHTART
jgi:uncharacterized protein YjbJ (UPF0337 family)